MSRQASRFDWFWRLTHPRKAQKRAQRQAEEQAQAELEQNLTFLRHRQEREEAFRLACDPNTTPDELRRLITESYTQATTGQNHSDYAHLYFHAGRTFHLAYHDEFDRLRQAISAHPNLPLDLIGGELPVTDSTVAGLLANPICPLLLLERPDFFAAMPEESVTSFAHHALRHENLPRSLLRALTTISDPWMALEAMTHIGNAPESEQTMPPDIVWLDAQVIERLRAETFERRCLVFELGWLRLIPENIQQENPWLEPEVSVPSRLFTEEEVTACVREAGQLSRKGRKQRDDWHARWRGLIESRNNFRNVRVLMKYSPADLFFRAVVSHGEAPAWVAQELTTRHGSFYRIPAMLHPEALPRFVANWRQSVLNHALAGPTRLESAYYCPGIFYLILRDLPNPFRHPTLPATHYNVMAGVHNTQFLMRLAVALRLDDTFPEQRALRETLVDDPNRYVRAAARREITWPNHA